MRTGPKYSPKRQRSRDKALKALIGRAGSLSALARVADVSRQAASKWPTVPERYAQALSQAFPE